MGAYESPQIGMVDYSVGRAAFNNAYNSVYTMFKSYYDNVAKEEKDLRKKVEKTWDPTGWILEESAKVSQKVLAGINKAGYAGKDYFMSIGGGGGNAQPQAANQFNHILSITNDFVKSALVDIESYDVFDKADPNYDKYRYVNELIQNGKMEADYSFVPPGEEAPGLGHQWFNAAIILKNQDGTVVNNEKYGIKDGRITLNSINALYTGMNTNKVNWAVSKKNLNDSIAAASGRITTELANDIQAGDYNTLGGHLGRGVGDILKTKLDIDNYYVNMMTPNDRRTGGAFNVNNGKVITQEPMSMKIGDQKYELPREFFTGAITRERIIGMFNEYYPDFDSSDDIQPAEEAMISGALEYRDNVAYAHLYRRLSIGKVDSYEPPPTIIKDTEAKWKHELAQAKVTTRNNEKILTGYMLGDVETGAFSFNSSEAHYWNKHKIVGEEFDAASGELDLLLQLVDSKGTLSAADSWATLNDKEKGAFEDSLKKYKESYVSRPTHNTVDMWLSDLEGRNGKKLKLWKERDINQLLITLADSGSTLNEITNDITSQSNYGSMIAGHIYSDIMSDASLFSDETGMPTDKGWEEIKKMLPRKLIDDIVIQPYGDRGLDPHLKNEIMMLIRNLRKK